MKRLNKGFTLSELLIVVAIIAVLVAIAIPVFTTQLEKSREATDLANVRSAYAQIMVMATTEEQPTDDSGISRSGEAGHYEYKTSVSLKQKQTDWQTSKPITLAEITWNGADVPGKWEGTPTGEGNCEITFSFENGILFKWDGETINSGSSQSEPTYSFNAGFFEKSRKISGWSFMGTYKDYDKSKYSEEDYQEYLNELKQMAGITSDNFYYDFSTATKRLKFTEKDYGYDNSQGIYRLPEGETYTIVEFDSSGNVVKIYKNTVTKENPVSFGYNASNGIVGYWDNPNKYELISDFTSQE